MMNIKYVTATYSAFQSNKQKKYDAKDGIIK